MRERVLTAARPLCGMLLSGMVLFVLAAPALAQQNAPAAGPFGRLAIKSQILGEDRVALVRTPAGYEASGARYPVLYLTDGDRHIEHTAATIAFLAREGRMPEMIVVGIVNTVRSRDLSPTRAGLRRHDGQMVEVPESGGADKFLKFIETELMPEVERRYRTQPCRLLAGHSFGGLFAVHAFLSRPELFNGVIAVSPTLNWDDSLPVRRAEAFFRERRELSRTLFLTMANEGGEMRSGYEKFRALLEAQKTSGFAWGAQLWEDEDHGSVVMRSHYFGLRKIFEDWTLAREAGTNAVVGGLAGVQSHYQKLSRRFGYAIAPPEAIVNQIGYQLLAAGKKEEAIAAFKSNVENYPASANVYDSLAEAYEQAGKLDLAAPLYEKAYHLGRQNNDPALETFKRNAERTAAALKKP